LIAKQYGQDTILSSIQLGVESVGNFGNCNWGLQLRLHQFDIVEFRPRSRFRRKSIRVWPSSACSVMEQVRRSGGAGRKQNASILDSVTQEISFFKKPLGAGDRSRLDTYLENIREIERRIIIATDKTIKEPSEEIPFGLPESKHVHYRLMYDLIALAFEGDLTRSATMMFRSRSFRQQLPRVRVYRGMAWNIAPWRQPENIANYAKMKPLSRAETWLTFADKLKKDTRWRRQCSRSCTDL